MNETDGNRIETLVRLSRRNLFVALLMIFGYGATGLAAALRPDSMLATWPILMPWIIPVLTVFVGLALALPLRRIGWDPNSPLAKAILNDELRQRSLARARTITLVIVLAAQVPLGLLLMDFPAQRAVLGMAIATITLGMVSLIAFFLYFDRE